MLESWRKGYERLPFGGLGKNCSCSWRSPKCAGALPTSFFFQRPTVLPLAFTIATPAPQSYSHNPVYCGFDRKSLSQVGGDDKTWLRLSRFADNTNKIFEQTCACSCFDDWVPGRYFVRLPTVHLLRKPYYRSTTGTSSRPSCLAVQLSWTRSARRNASRKHKSSTAANVVAIGHARTHCHGRVPK